MRSFQSYPPLWYHIPQGQFSFSLPISLPPGCLQIILERTRSSVRSADNNHNYSNSCTSASSASAVSKLVPASTQALTRTHTPTKCIPVDCLQACTVTSLTSAGRERESAKQHCTRLVQLGSLHQSCSTLAPLTYGALFASTLKQHCERGRVLCVSWPHDNKCGARPRYLWCNQRQ